VWPRSRDLLLNFGSLYISGTAKPKNLKFGVQIDYNEYYSQNSKFWDRRAWLRSRDLLLYFRTLDLYISGTANATNMKFGVQIYYNECYSKCKILGQKGVAWSRDLLFNSGISGRTKATKFQKLAIEMTGISGPRGRAHSERGAGPESSGGFALSPRN